MGKRYSMAARDEGIAKRDVHFPSSSNKSNNNINCVHSDVIGIRGICEGSKTAGLDYVPRQHRLRKNSVTADLRKQHVTTKRFFCMFSKFENHVNILLKNSQGKSVSRGKYLDKQ